MLKLRLLYFSELIRQVRALTATSFNDFLLALGSHTGLLVSYGSTGLLPVQVGQDRSKIMAGRNL